MCEPDGTRLERSNDACLPLRIRSNRCREFRRHCPFLRRPPLQSWSSPSPHIVRDKNGGSAYRRVGAAASSGENSSRVSSGFSVCVESILVRPILMPSDSQPVRKVPFSTFSPEMLEIGIYFSSQNVSGVLSKIHQGVVLESRGVRLQEITVGNHFVPNEGIGSI